MTIPTIFLGVGILLSSAQGPVEATCSWPNSTKGFEPGENKGDLRGTKITAVFFSSSGQTLTHKRIRIVVGLGPESQQTHYRLARFGASENSGAQETNHITWPNPSPPSAGQETVAHLRSWSLGNSDTDISRKKGRRERGKRERNTQVDTLI